MTREELQRLYSECVSRAFRAEQLAALVRGVERFLSQPDPAEAAEQTVRRVRAQCDSWSHGNSWNKAARNAILRALDGGGER